MPTVSYADTLAGENRWVDPKPSRHAAIRAVEYGPQCVQTTRLNNAVIAHIRSRAPRTTLPLVQ